MTEENIKDQQKIRKLKIIRFILLVSAYIFFITFVTLGYNMPIIQTKIFFFVSSGIVFIFFISRVKKIGFEINFIKNELDFQNKTNPVHNYNLQTLKDQYQTIYKPDLNDEIDDYTWSDLNLDDFYSKTSFLLTSPGEIALYSFLRTPIFELETLSNRNKIIEEIRQSGKTRNTVMELLTNIGKDQSNSIVDLLFENITYAKIWKYLCRSIFIVSILSIVLLFFNLKIAVFMLLACSILGSYIHAKMQIVLNFEALEYFKNMLKSVNEKISKISKHEVLREKAAEINTKAGNLFLKKSHFLILPTTDKSSILFTVYEYFNMLFLLQENAFFSGYQYITRNKKDFEHYFKYIGELDALLSIAKLKNSLDYHCTPVLNDENLNLEFNQIYHPLIDKPVSNNFDLKCHGVLITGSNMSGKSTFLRTIGINVLLSQTFFFACAESFKCNFMHIISSVNLTDNLLTGKSYYYMEAERIKKVIQISQSGFKVFV